MPVSVDADGRRWIAIDVEVPGAPEEVWAAVATGPGISAWFVPSTVEEREGGTTTSSFGPGMDSVARITTWEPPHRFVAESHDAGPDDPAVATEWSVTAHAGGTCTVRVMHSWFLDDDRWDAQYEQHGWGWVGFFKLLRLYLEHFRGQESAGVALSAMTQLPLTEAWAKLAEPLGLADVQDGDPVSPSDEAPRLVGTVEDAGHPDFPNRLLRIVEPGPGLVNAFPMALGGMTLITLRFFLYGPTAPTRLAERAEAEWQGWLTQRYG